MSGTDAGRPTFSVEMGEAGPKLRIRIGERSIPVDIEPGQAAQLAASLLAASVFCSPDHPRRPEGEVFGEAVLPVVSWKTGIVNASGLPLLFATIRGGASVILGLPPEQAAACGSALHATAGDILARAAATADPEAGA